MLLAGVDKSRPYRNLSGCDVFNHKGQELIARDKARALRTARHSNAATTRFISSSTK